MSTTKLLRRARAHWRCSALRNPTQTPALAHPSQSVALDPGFAGKKSRQFACGGVAAQLVLNSKGWMGSRDHVLHAGEGTVRCVRWCGALIAWANDLGVKLYDSGAHTRIAYIDRPQGSPRPEAFPPHLAWETDKTLIVGWADCIKVARIVRARVFATMQRMSLTSSPCAERAWHSP